MRVEDADMDLKFTFTPKNISGYRSLQRTNPFDFKHHNLTQVGVYVGGGGANLSKTFVFEI